MLSYCHFHSFLILHYIYYISQRSNAKNCSRITGLQRQDSKPSADNNMRYSPSKSITEYQIHKEGGGCEQIFDSSTTFFNPLVGTNSLYGKRTVSFFSLASHALNGHVRLAHARLLRHALPISLLILRRKKTDCFAV